MTAASGILHREFHSEAFGRSGGILDMVHLWVNLPAQDKLSAPHYQTQLDCTIPAIEQANDAGTLRVIAGQFDGRPGPAQTFTPINVWDLRLKQVIPVSLPMVPGHTAALVVLHGTVLVNGSEVVREAQTVLFERAGEEVPLEASSDAYVLLLAGEPIDEPIAGYGPFVMDSKSEVRQAIKDFETGRFGQLDD